MFKISRRLDYGIQLMVALAENGKDQAIPTAALAKKLNIPLPFLHQIGHTLMQNGLIKASPGPKGGLRLTLPPEEISLLTITEALEGAVCLVNCADCGQKGNSEPPCTLKGLWNYLQSNLIKELSYLRLSMLIHGAVDHLVKNPE